MTTAKIDPLELEFGSELPTRPDLERATLAARLAAKALARRADEPVWCDSEAPTGVEVERPLFPPPPRAPRV